LLDLDGRVARENDTRNEEDTRKFVESMKNVNTKNKTKSDVNRIKKRFQSKNEFRELYDIPPQELNRLLVRFFLI